MTIKLDGSKLISLGMVTSLLYLSSPFFVGFCLRQKLDRGDFPVNADSIGIPFFGFFVLWLVFAPAIASFVVWAFGSAPRKFGLFGVNKDRPFWSFAWTLLFASAIFVNLLAAIDLVLDELPLYAILPISSVILLLIYRGIVVFRGC